MGQPNMCIVTCMPFLPLLMGVMETTKQARRMMDDRLISHLPQYWNKYRSQLYKYASYPFYFTTRNKVPPLVWTNSYFILSLLSWFAFKLCFRIDQFTNYISYTNRLRQFQCHITFIYLHHSWFDATPSIHLLLLL